MIEGLLYGILSGLILMGIGIITSAAAKRKLSMVLIQGIGALLLIGLFPLISGNGMVFSGENAAAINLLMLLAGVGNFVTFLLIQQAMKTGHNGIIWSLANSALIFPFLAGILFFHVPPEAPRFAGAALIVGGIVLAGAAQKTDPEKTQNPGNRKWFFWALASLFSAGITQTAANIPSYLSGIERFSNLQKGLVMQIGIAVVAGLYLLFARGRLPVSKSETEKRSWLRQTLLLAVALAAVNGLTLCVFMYRSFDLLARAGIGSVAYPVVLGTCIAGFFLYSLVVLREKASIPAVLSFFLTVAGIAVIAL